MSASILLVEPDAETRERIRALLASRSYGVSLAPDAHGAWRTGEGELFHLVISELELSGADGLSLVSRLRERDPDQEIILTAKRPELRAQAHRAGVSDCLVKPIDEAELLFAVERCLERAQLRHERARLLSENVEFAKSQSLSQRCLDFLSNLDLDWVQERVLGDLASACDAQSAALWLLDERRMLVLKSYRGLLDRQTLPEQLDAEGTLKLRLSHGMPWRLGHGRELAVCAPLIAQGELFGLAQLSDPLSGEFYAEQLRSAKLLCDFSAVAVKNARRFSGLQRQGLKDRESGAYNLSYFTDYASKEIYKARRFSRVFSLLTFSIDNLSLLKLRLGAEEAAIPPRAITRALTKIARDSDVLAKASENEFYLLLPETDYFGALMFARRALAVIREDTEIQALESRMPLALVSGAATYPKDGDDFDELVFLCRARMEERRQSLQRRLLLDGLAFWEEVELLVGTPTSAKLPQDERAEPSRRGSVSETLFEEVQEEIARELLRTPHSRGVLYLGTPDIRAQSPLAIGLEQAPADFAFRVYALGRRADLDAHKVIAPVFLEGDEAIARHEFLLWLSERSAYALLQRRGLGATWGFHTCDTAVVDGLIAKLQTQYDLQPY